MMLRQTRPVAWHNRVSCSSTWNGNAPMRPTLYVSSPLKAKCARKLTGRRPVSARDHLTAMADLAQTHNVAPDSYGSGQYVERFEADLAARLGHEQALLFPTGAMAQQVACRIAADRRSKRGLIMHPTCQMALNEFEAYAVLHGLEARFVGTMGEPPTPSDLQNAVSKNDAAAFVHEVPMRQLGCQATPLETLDELLSVVQSANVHTHLDGARLWEILPYYGVDADVIARRFESVYVSFYKGVAGFAGAALAGDAAFIAEARIWRRRHGGELKQFTPFALTADMGLDAAIAAASKDWARARELAGFINHTPGLTTTPSTPHCGTFHVSFEASVEALERARDDIATEHGVWLFDFFFEPYPGRGVMTELVITEQADDIYADEKALLLDQFADRVRVYSG